MVRKLKEIREVAEVFCPENGCGYREFYWDHVFSTRTKGLNEGKCFKCGTSTAHPDGVNLLIDYHDGKIRPKNGSLK
ncbi:MAG: hypothetical protein PHI88_00865 [Candidatus Pacebacteria bacterium]|nr:hypothetical protein [Candidatus Paceibacterota bacterium]